MISMDKKCNVIRRLAKEQHLVISIKCDVIRRLVKEEYFVIIKNKM